MPHRDAADATIRDLTERLRLAEAECEAAREWLEMGGFEDDENGPNCGHEDPPRWDDGSGDCSECVSWQKWKQTRAARDKGGRR